MKLFSLLLSILVFFTSLYFFVLKVPNISTLNDVIYISLLVVLMAICIVGVIINWEFFRRKKKNRIILFVNNGFSNKKIK
ncbi:hypothetical protein R1T16_07010 [Flavobacterium sp. DG1-102-2]|uniref:hypothetical protein n=1 Tax=Flavobacterium sp. DG1-102-2 TaxID=3081663 RepID=UPI0029495486|nr:hypothetical protein [Flavobacterium sp. DG1-102-2]MDV6168169.1 hypothetical protein [Flavobacterium sp. DG1-102-2]